jgi:uncharacterized protein YjbJ (UPF0337 family)
MNIQQVLGTATDLAGRVQEQAGKFTGNRDLEIKGLLKRANGHAQKSIGNARAKVRPGGQTRSPAGK